MRRIWRGEPPFEGADPVGPPPVQPGGPPVVAGVMGPKATARAAHWADGVDGAWTMDGDLEHMTTSFAMVRDAWQAAGRTEAPHLSTSIWYALGDDAEERLRTYAYDYMRIFGEGVGEWAATQVSCFTPDALRRAVDNADGGGRRRVLPRAHHRRPRRARAHHRRARRPPGAASMTRGDSSTGCSTRWRPRRGSTTTANRRSARDFERLCAAACTTGDLNPIGQAAFEGQVKGHLANRLRVTDCHRSHPEVARRGGGGADRDHRAAPDGHHRAQPPAGVRPRRTARCSGGRRGSRYRRRGPRPTGPTRGFTAAREAERDDGPAQPGVQGDPPRPARQAHRVRRAARAALPVGDLLDRVHPARTTTSGCSPPTPTAATRTTGRCSSCCSRSAPAGGS